MSRQYFDFSGLILDYSNTFEVITHKAGGYDAAGDWQDGQEMRDEYTGAIIAFSESKRLRSEGAISEKDLRLFMLDPMPGAVMDAAIVFKGNKYTLMAGTENAEFTGVYSYMLKFVSAFNE